MKGAGAIDDIVKMENKPYHEPAVLTKEQCRFHEPLSLRAKIKQRIMKEKTKEKIEKLEK